MNGEHTREHERMDINLLYISYWSSGDALTSSTVIPHISIAAEFDQIKKIVLLTTERGGKRREIILPKTQHVFVQSASTGIRILDRILDFIRLPAIARKLAKENRINLIIGKGALAGAVADKTARSLGIPYVTESFEPHADYMSESDEWNDNGFKFMYLKKWEKEQISRAYRIFTVSDNYKAFLSRNHSLKNVSTIPCCVNLDAFSYSEEKRKQIREKYGLGNGVTGIYAGRFGGIYFKREAFDIFAECFGYFRDFRLIILSADDPAFISKELRKRKIDISKVVYLFVAHDEVPAYLSAADFAFSLIKPAESKMYCCPVKDGEYWANGLPILLTEGIGDDCRILEEENGGALFLPSKNNLRRALEKINSLIQTPGYRERIQRIAQRHRSYSITRQVYGELFGGDFQAQKL